MALLGNIHKQPREIVPVDITYAAVINGRTASSITPSVEAPAGMTAVSSVVTGDKLQIYVSGGTTNNTYRWTVLTDIVIGGRTTRVEDEFDVVVWDV